MDSVKFVQSERLFHIEFLALFTGRVSRKDLKARFGISEAAATKDISLYLDMASNVIKYDIKKKVYLYESDENLHYDHDVEQSLFALAGDRVTSVGIKSVQYLPSWVNTNIKKPQSLGLVTLITRCMNSKLKATVKYSSKSSGENEKQLTPLAVFNDGARWFIRCFDHSKGFRNYSLEGFMSVSINSESSISIDEDDMWNKIVTVKLKPHPKADHPDSILRDYSNIKEGLVEVKLRACLVGFFLRKWQVDCSPEAKGNPDYQQLALANQVELKNKGLENFDIGIPS